jgi:hypothetical protein
MQQDAPVHYMSKESGQLQQSLQHTINMVLKDKRTLRSNIIIPII